MAVMNHNQQFKIAKLAKDLGMKSKELVEVLSKNGIEAKTTQKALEPVEFDILFDTITRQNQIVDIGSYLSGASYIPSKVKKEAPKKEEPKKEEVPASAVEEKKSEVKASAPKAEVKEEKKESRPQSAASQPAKNAEAKEEKIEQKPESKKAEPVQAQKRDAAPAAPARPQARQPYTGNPYRPGEPAQIPARPAQTPARPAQQGFARPSAQGQQQGGKPFGARPQGAPATGFGASPSNSERPARQNSFDRFNRDAYADRGGFGGDRRQTKAPAQQGRGFQQGKGGSFGRGGFGGDKGDYVQNAPRETFKAQPIVRGASTNVNPDGTLKGPRVVDTKSSTVDLSKYDERLETFVSERDDRSFQSSNNQRVKKPGAGQMGQSFGRQQNGKKGKGARGAAPAPVVTVKPTHIELPEEIVVGQLASKLMITSGEVVKKLIMMGVMATVNQVVDFDTASLVAMEFGVEATPEVVVSIEEKLFDEAEDSEEQLVERAPVVCVMGHVDHGKTSILDAIRNSHVTAGEAGGITQHIGAYRVKVGDKDLTFLDTPGHAAFTAMRARGAMATDIAILVVAADDGIMPQTVEAINHAKAAGIDIVVAINKMDKPTANPDAVKQELTKHGLVTEEWGGDTICVPVSALKRQGIDDLLESVLLIAEVKELKANPNRRAKGLVIESKLDRGRGPVATVLVQNGTLRNGDIIIAGTAVGRVRSMSDHNGKLVKEASPSVPVEITGLAEVPSAGDEFQVVADERMARSLADQRRAQAKEDVFKANARANLNDLFAQISDGVKDLNIIVKADVDGSVEAVKASLIKLSNEEVKVRVIHAAVGGITEGDVTFAAASNAIIVGFNVRPDKSALDSAERQNVDVRTYRVIYECIEEIDAAMKGMLAPKFRENLLGHAEVRQTIHVPNVGTIAGSYIQDGKITRQSQIRVVRDGIVIFEDKISSLKRFKDDAREVAAGYECGVGLEKFNDIKVGDILEAFVMEQI